MARTTVGVNDPKAVKRWAGMLAMDQSQTGYFSSKFAGRGQTAELPIQILTDLENDAGDQIAYDLLAELRNAPVEGDNTLEDNEESQRFYTDQVYIDQMRHGVNTGGAMTRKRTLNNLREKAKRQLANYFANANDQLLFMYLAGARGVNTNFLYPLGFTGRAGNPLVTPSSNHHLFGGAATAFANITATDTMSLTVIDKAKTRADTQGGGSTNIPVLQPCKVDGNERFVCVMHTWQEDDLRRNPSTGQWLDIAKAASAAEGRDSPLYKGGMGLYRGVVLHSHRNVIRFNNAGASANVESARGLFLGAQAAVMAYGSPGTGVRYDWKERMADNGNMLIITAGCMAGVKKVTFQTETGANDFGVYALDTAAASAGR
jgi:N4-gp56 family major capsid protein